MAMTSNGLSKWIERAENITMALGMFIISLIIFVNVIMRYAFNSGLYWAEELVRYIVIYIVFIGTSIAVSRKAHINVDLYMNLKKKWKRDAFDFFNDLASICFSLFMLVVGIAIIIDQKDMGQTSTALEIPMYLVYLAMPIGGGLMLIRYLIQFGSRIASLKHTNQ
jgi:C4-dicarboxylate transporter DctQ subunit